MSRPGVGDSGRGLRLRVSVRLQLRADRREDTRCADPGPTSGRFVSAVGRPASCRHGLQSLAGEAFESGWIRVGRGVRASRFAAALSHDLRDPLAAEPGRRILRTAVRRRRRRNRAQQSPPRNRPCHHVPRTGLGQNRCSARLGTAMALAQGQGTEGAQSHRTDRPSPLPEQRIRFSPTVRIVERSRRAHTARLRGAVISATITSPIPRQVRALPACHWSHGTDQSPFCHSSSGAPPVLRTSTMSPGTEKS